MTTDYYGNSALSMGSTINDKNDNSSIFLEINMKLNFTQLTQLDYWDDKESAVVWGRIDVVRKTALGRCRWNFLAGRSSE